MSRKVTGSADVEAEEGVEFTNPASDDIIDVDDHVKLEETSDGLFEPDCVESQAEKKKKAQQLESHTGPCRGSQELHSASERPM